MPRFRQGFRPLFVICNMLHVAHLILDLDCGILGDGFHPHLLRHLILDLVRRIPSCCPTVCVGEWVFDFDRGLLGTPDMGEKSFM